MFRLARVQFPILLAIFDMISNLCQVINSSFGVRSSWPYMVDLVLAEKGLGFDPGRNGLVVLVLDRSNGLS